MPEEPEPASARPHFVDSVGSALVRAAREHRAVVASDLANLGLYPGQDILLAVLWETDNVPQVELTARLGVEPPTVVKAVQRLEAGGFVYRCRDPADGRVSRIRLAPNGQALREQVERIWAAAEERMLTGLDEYECGAASRAIKMMYHNLHKSRGKA